MNKSNWFLYPVVVGLKIKPEELSNNILTDFNGMSNNQELFYA